MTTTGAALNLAHGEGAAARRGQRPGHSAATTGQGHAAAAAVAKARPARGVTAARPVRTSQPIGGGDEYRGGSGVSRA